ncbi:lipoprotein LpqH [Nocardia sp. BMG111209]|uniref:lipoprotein LpqH n=1 Tax=Nocardia sp. BMG111209 TaxID=1160137 RepID=UPI00036A008B|nr:lipoprotein LpqH [Nocardia sp. BMG111209]
MRTAGRTRLPTTVLGTVLILAAATVSACGSGDSVRPALKAGPVTATTTGAATPSAASPSQPATLPFTGLQQPRGLAVSPTGDVFVADRSGGVLGLATGADKPVPVITAGPGSPAKVALDTAGNLYVTYGSGVGKVLKAIPGSDTPITVPFADTTAPAGVAVDGVGNVYITDETTGRVLESAAGTNAQTVLPFPGLVSPQDVAVDHAGAVYVADRQRVQKLAPGATAPAALPFTGLTAPQAVAVDAAGNIYVADHDSNRVLRLAAGAATATVVPFGRLTGPDGVATDAAGDVYVVGDDRTVLKLPAARAAVDAAAVPGPATTAGSSTPAIPGHATVLLDGVDQHAGGTVECTTADGFVTIRISGSLLTAKLTTTDPPQAEEATVAGLVGGTETWSYKRGVAGTATVTKSGTTYRITGTAARNGSAATTKPFEFAATCP